MSSAVGRRLAKLEARQVQGLDALSDQAFAGRVRELLEAAVAADPDAAETAEAVRGFAAHEGIAGAQTAPLQDVWAELKFELDCQCAGLRPARVEAITERVREVRAKMAAAGAS